jgi:hypothetical protein
MSRRLGRALRPNSRGCRPDHAHCEQDEAPVVGYGQLKVRVVPEVLSDVAKELSGVFDRLAFGVAEIVEFHALVILNKSFKRIVRMEEEARHGAATFGRWVGCRG